MDKCSAVGHVTQQAVVDFTAGEGGEGSRTGVGVTKPISSAPFFFYDFSPLLRKLLLIEYRVHIWQVSLQLRCGDTC